MYNELILSLNYSYRKFKDKDKEPAFFYHFLAVLGLKYINDTKNKILPFKLEPTVTESLQQLFKQHNSATVASALDKVLNQLSKKYKSTLAGVFEDISFRQLISNKEKGTENRLLTLLEEVVELDLSNTAVDTIHGPVVGAAVEYLIEKFSEEHFHKNGFLYTPRSISKLMADLASLDASTSVYDPAAGLGTLLIQCSRAGNIPDYKLYGQELNPQYVQLCKFNMLFNGLIKAEIETSNSLQESKFTSGKKPMQFDRIVTHPPYQIENLLPAHPELAFATNGETKSHLYVVEEPAVAYRSTRDEKAAKATEVQTDFLTHIIHSLQEEGRAVMIVPHGALFKLGNAYTVRKYLVSKNWIEGVVDLPPNVFYSSKTNVSILILNKNKSHTDILFIDASSAFEPDRRRNKLRTEHAAQIIEAYEGFKSVKNYAHRASVQEVAESNNNFNLTAKRYIKPSLPKFGKDTLQPLKETIRTLSSELENVQKSIDEELKYFTAKS